jgi:hypothetical protein
LVEVVFPSSDPFLPPPPSPFGLFYFNQQG